MQKHIFHIHDRICGHATLTLEEAVGYALKHGYKELYYTEHCPILVKCFYATRRAPYDEVVDLRKRIDLVNTKYKGKLHVYFGYEMEYNSYNYLYLEKLARDPLCDYLIFGNHFYGNLFAFKGMPMPLVMYTTDSKQKLQEFLHNQINGCKCGLYSWIAHPEIFLNSYKKWDCHAKKVCKTIIKYAKRYKLPLGFNVNCQNWQTKSEWHYPSSYFWKMVAKTNIPVVIESDAHDLYSMKVEWLAHARKLACEYGLEKNLTESISIKWLPKRPLMVLYEKHLYKSLSKDMVNNLKGLNVKFVKVNSRTNIKRMFAKTKIPPVWTLAIVDNINLINKLKQTSSYLISNKDCDLSIRNFSKLTYKKFLNEFIKKN